MNDNLTMKQVYLIAVMVVGLGFGPLVLFIVDGGIVSQTIGVACIVIGIGAGIFGRLGMNKQNSMRNNLRMTGLRVEAKVISVQHQGFRNSDFFSVVVADPANETITFTSDILLGTGDLFEEGLQSIRAEGDDIVFPVFVSAEDPSVYVVDIPYDVESRPIQMAGRVVYGKSNE
jgi:hypothetical protein